MQNQKRQPIFNAIPPVILTIIIIISFISLLGIFSPFIYDTLEFYGALMPAQFSILNAYRLISYGFLHKDYSHLAMNMVWLLIFASPIQRSFGVKSFLIIFTMGLIVGGAVFLMYDNNSVVIGASAGVSACAGAALRFILRPASDFYGRPQIYKLTDGRFLLPTTLFFITDIVQALVMSSTGYTVAWQSHIVGYVTGAILMNLKFINHGAITRSKLTASEQRYHGD